MKRIQKTGVEKGQGLVELALLLPILVLFIMIIFDLGRVAYYHSAVNNAAREGARYASIHYRTATSSDIYAAASRLTSGMDKDLLTITTSYPGSDIVKVTASYEFTAATPILAQLMGYASNSITLTSQATMNLEQ